MLTVAISRFRSFWEANEAPPSQLAQKIFCGLRLRHWARIRILLLSNFCEKLSLDFDLNSGQKKKRAIWWHSGLPSVAQQCHLFRGKSSLWWTRSQPDVSFLFPSLTVFGESLRVIWLNTVQLSGHPFGFLINRGGACYDRKIWRKIRSQLSYS